MEQTETQEAIDYAYKVLTAIMEGEKACLSKPEKLAQLFNEAVNSLPQIQEAFLIITKPEHRGIVADLFRSTAYLLSEAQKKLKEKTASDKVS